MSISLDTPVLFFRNPTKSDSVEMSAHVALLTAGYMVLARVPFEVRSTRGVVLATAAFSRNTASVSGDSIFVAALSEHTQVLDRISQGMLVGLTGGK